MPFVERTSVLAVLAGLTAALAWALWTLLSDGLVMTYGINKHGRPGIMWLPLSRHSHGHWFWIAVATQSLSLIGTLALAIALCVTSSFPGLIYP